MNTDTSRVQFSVEELAQLIRAATAGCQFGNDEQPCMNALSKLRDALGRLNHARRAVGQTVIYSD